MEDTAAAAAASPDPSRKVGCVIVTSDGQTINQCNNIVRGCRVTPERLTRPEKYTWIEHAERNAIYEAARRGISLLDATLYVNYFPCIECCRAVIQSGISTLVVPGRPDLDHPRWGPSFRQATVMMEEVGLRVVYNNE